MISENVQLQISSPIRKMTRKTMKAGSRNLPGNENARLIILKQTHIMNSIREDVEFDRFTSLLKRIIKIPYAFLSFIDLETQWVKSNIGIVLKNPSIPREKSIDALFMFPETPEIKVIFDMDTKTKYQNLKNIYNFPNNELIEFYAGVVISVEGFRLGVLSVIDTKPRNHFEMEDRQNLLDLAAAIATILKERRQKNLRFRKQRANLLLGLNHNLRTPLMALTMATEMLRTEIKKMAIFTSQFQISPDALSTGGSFFSLDGSIIKEDHIVNIDHDKKTFRNANASSHNTSKQNVLSELLPSLSTGSKSSSKPTTPDLPCMNLFGDVQSSLQQLSLLVEMGLLLGKITSSTSYSTDGSYESSLCDLLLTYEKVKALTNRVGKNQNIIWNIHKSSLSSDNGHYYCFPDVLMFVLICSISQLLPHSDLIRVRGSFVSAEEASQNLQGNNDCALNAINSVADITASNSGSLYGKVGFLVTEIEAIGNPVNLGEIASKLGKVPYDSEKSSMTGTTSTSSEASEECLQGTNSGSHDPGDDENDPEVEVFGGNIYAVGTLLENVFGGSYFLNSDFGCIFSFSLPCRIEIDPVSESDTTPAPNDKRRISFAATSEENHPRRRNSHPNDRDDNADEHLRLHLQPHHIPPAHDFNINGEAFPNGYYEALKLLFPADEKSPINRSSTNSETNEKPPSTGGMTRSPIVEYLLREADSPPQTSRLTLQPPSTDDNSSFNMLPNPPSIFGSESILLPRTVDQTINLRSCRGQLSPRRIENRPRGPSDGTPNEEKQNRFLREESHQLYLKQQLLDAIQLHQSKSFPEHHRSLHILVVDDSITVLKILSIWLAKNHCTVTQAVNGSQALELMKTNCYDIILMDFLMPIMDGLTCLKMFQDFLCNLESLTDVQPSYLERVKDQWIIGLSATALPEDQLMAFQTGMHMFCTKPVDMQGLKIVLEAKRLNIDLPALVSMTLESYSRKISPSHATEEFNSNSDSTSICEDKLVNIPSETTSSSVSTSQSTNSLTALPPPPPRPTGSPSDDTNHLQIQHPHKLLPRIHFTRSGSHSNSPTKHHNKSSTSSSQYHSPSRGESNNPMIMNHPGHAIAAAALAAHHNLQPEQQHHRHFFPSPAITHGKKVHNNHQQHLQPQSSSSPTASSQQNKNNFPHQHHHEQSDDCDQFLNVLGSFHFNPIYLR